MFSRETAAKIGGSPRRRRRYRDTWTTARPVVGRLVSVRLGSWLRENSAMRRTRRTLFLRLTNGNANVRKTARIRSTPETRFPSVDDLSGFSHSQGHLQTKRERGAFPPSDGTTPKTDARLAKRWPGRETLLRVRGSHQGQRHPRRDSSRARPPRHPAGVRRHRTLARRLARPCAAGWRRRRRAAARLGRAGACRPLHDGPAGEAGQRGAGGAGHARGPLALREPGSARCSPSARPTR